MSTCALFLSYPFILELWKEQKITGIFTRGDLIMKRQIEKKRERDIQNQCEELRDRQIERKKKKELREREREREREKESEKKGECVREIWREKEEKRIMMRYTQSKRTYCMSKKSCPILNSNMKCVKTSWTYKSKKLLLKYEYCTIYK